MNRIVLFNRTKACLMDKRTNELLKFHRMDKVVCMVKRLKKYAA